MKKATATIDCSADSVNCSAKVSVDSDEKNNTSGNKNGDPNAEKNNGGELKQTIEVKIPCKCMGILSAIFAILIIGGTIFAITQLKNVDSTSRPIFSIVKISISLALVVITLFLATNFSKYIMKMEFFKGIINISGSPELKKKYCDTLLEL